MDFSEMNDYDFDDFVLGKKTRFENEAKEREAEAKRLEAERLAEIEKQKAIEAENAILKAKLDAERLESQRLAKIEADKNAKLEAELKAKLDAENEVKKLEAERLEAEKKEAELKAKAPIKEQLNIWVNSFELPSRTIINEQSDEIVLKFEAFKKWAKNQLNQ